MDVTDKDQITALADKAWAHFGHVDILFNNAGVGAGLKPGDKTEDDDLRWVFEVNFFGTGICAWSFCAASKRKAARRIFAIRLPKIPSLAHAFHVGL